MKRQMVIIAILCSLIFVAIPVQAQPNKALTLFTVALDWYINPDQGPILVAQQQGFFKQAGLKVKLISPTQSGEPEKLVVTGQADVAISYPSYLAAAQKHGLPLVKVGNLFDKSVNCLVVLDRSPIRRLADLKGKTIGYSGGLSKQKIVKTMLSHAGVAPDQVHWVNVQMDLSQALLSHKVDAVWGMSRNVEPVQLKALGHPVRLFIPQDYGVPDQDSYIFVARTPLKNKPALQAFLNAVQKGVSYIKKYPKKSWQQVMQAYPTALAPSKKVAESNYQVWLASIDFYSDKVTQTLGK